MNLGMVDGRRYVLITNPACLLIVPGIQEFYTPSLSHPVHSKRLRKAGAVVPLHEQLKIGTRRGVFKQAKTDQHSSCEDKRIAVSMFLVHTDDPNP